MNIEIHRDPNGEWAALYLEGKLDTGPADAYHCDERLYELFRVKIVYDGAFLRGGDGVDRGNGRGAPARTLAEVEEYRRQRDENVAAAQKMREEADRLLRQANLRDPEGRR